jgi:hypothetical protein
MNKENVVYIHSRVLFSHKNEIVSFAGKWMELQVMFSKIHQTRRQILHVFSHMQNLDLNRRRKKKRMTTI